MDELREALLSLDPDGEDGLEGLVAHALSSLIGRQFRVAASGRQHGRDGATNAAAFDVFFEAKLYSGKPPSSESLQAKLFSAIKDHQPNLDLWILACTAPIGENAEKDIVAAGNQFGVTVLVLDWSQHPLPPLAVLLATATDAVLEWMAQHSATTISSVMQAGLATVRSHSSYNSILAEIVHCLSPAMAGWGMARARNAEWLAAALANRARARQVFGQFIAPDDPVLPAVARQQTTQQICAAMKESQDTIVVLIGDEGAGKTWSTVLAWQSLDDAPIFLLCTTDNPAWELALRAPLEFLAQLLIDQTGGAGIHDAKQRWLRRLDNWSKRETNQARIWLVLDGLNERESRPWSAVIDALMGLPSGLGIRLTLTSRPVFFRTRLLPRLTGYSVRELNIPSFSHEETLEAMQARGVDSASVPDTVREFLRNPRIFSIAIGMLDRVKPDELTRERLLFDYWRKRFEERRNLQHNDADFRRLLISHAQSMRSNLGTSSKSVASFGRDLWKEHSGLARRVQNPTIDDELTEIENGRFFEPDPDLDGSYRIRPESLAYTLGLLVVDELRCVPTDEMLINIETKIDPIRGLDLMADVLLAAVGIACIDPPCPNALAAALICSLLGIQNLADTHAEALLAYLPARPAAFIAAAESLWRESDSNLEAKRALGRLLHRRREHEAVRELLDSAIRRWLALWCAEPDALPRHAFSEADAEKVTKQRNERRARTARYIEELTAEERVFVERCCYTVDEPALMSIDSLALELVAGRPLAPFAEAIVAWQFCDTISGRIYSTRGVDIELAWLLRLNPIDLEATTQALHETLQRIETKLSSEAGLWTTIATLRATGLSQDAARADELHQKLPPTKPLRGWRRIENFCDTDPIDPNSSTPSNLSRALDAIAAIDPAKLRPFMSATSEDHDLAEFTPALARFAAPMLIDKVRAVARDLANRTGDAARLLAFKLPQFSALLTTDEIDLLRKVLASWAAATGQDHEQDIGAQYVLMAILPHLSAADQMEALLALPGEGGEIIQLRRFFKACDPDALAARLEQAETARDERSLRRIVFFASAGQTTLTDISRDVIQRCFVHSNHVIRLLAFQTAVGCDDRPSIRALAISDWSAATDKAETIEAFYGSEVLARTSEEFRNAETLMRMTVGWHTAVIDGWGLECIRQHAEILIQLIRKGLELPPGLSLHSPAKRNVADTATPVTYPFMSTADDDPEQITDLAQLKEALEEGDRAWKLKQLRKREVVDAYIAALQKRDATCLVDPAYVRGFETIAAHAPDMFERMIALLASASERQLRPLANIAACAARVLSRTQGDAASEMFDRLLGVRADVNLTIGPVELPFCTLALWTAEDTPSIQQLRARRLRNAYDDAELFVETLSALEAGKMSEVLALAEQLMAADHPGQIARAVTLAGFCDTNERASCIFEENRLKHGFLAHVTESARSSYERNQWAKHWYQRACGTENAIECWRYFALMIRAADGRFVLWFDPARDLKDTKLMPFARFAHDSLKNRAKKKLQMRREKLFGVRPPSSETLSAILDGGRARSDDPHATPKHR